MERNVANGQRRRNVTKPRSVFPNLAAPRAIDDIRGNSITRIFTEHYRRRAFHLGNSGDPVQRVRTIIATRRDSIVSSEIRPRCELQIVIAFERGPVRVIEMFNYALIPLEALRVYRANYSKIR